MTTQDRWTPWPEHKNPTLTRLDRFASAPYNFVPLPEKVVSAVASADELPGHDEYRRGSHSGYFDVTLTTRSPLYIRGPLTSAEYQRLEQDPQLKNKPEFFHTGDEQNPVIPGSSLRGMLRGLLEIVSYSKMQWVSEKQLFFRTVDKTAIGKYYNSRMVEEVDSIRKGDNRPVPVYRARAEGGFFRVNKDGKCYIDPCIVARVEIKDLVRLFGLTYPYELYQLDGRDLGPGKIDNPNQTPKWSYQHREIWAEIDKTGNNNFFPAKFSPDGKRMIHPDFYLRFRRARNLAMTPAEGKQAGKVVLTGQMQNKHLAFLFVPTQQVEPRLEVRNDPHEQDPNKRLLDRFHDTDQLTQWQTKAFPVDRSPDTRPKPDGHLRDGDPVFFLRDAKGELVFFGRAQMFRLPYTKSALELVDQPLRCAKQIDYAEALFGFVRTRQELQQLKACGHELPEQGEKGRAYAGRVIVTDAVLQSDPENIWLFEKAIIPKMLASPKPTAFQHYLTQQRPDEQRDLDHYDNQSANGRLTTTIRGHKIYWHQGLGFDQGLDLEKIRRAIEDGFAQAEERSPDTQHARMGPPAETFLDTQHTRMKPLKPGATFSFRVHFENLSERELGALCWTLHPRGEAGRRYCHHLGMGKPLGMGAVELHAQLHLINRVQRYNTLFSGDTWQSGEDLAASEKVERLTTAFEQHLLHELKPDRKCEQLKDMRRIAILLKLLEWPGYRAVEDGNRYLETEKRPNTRYMKIQGRYGNEYRYRPVLPNPTAFDPALLEKASPAEKARSQGNGGGAGPTFPARHPVPDPPAGNSDMQRADAAIRSLEVMREAEVAGQIYSYYQRWQKLTSIDARESLARAIVSKARKAGREATYVQKPWYQELLGVLLEEKNGHTDSQF